MRACTQCALTNGCCLYLLLKGETTLSEGYYEQINQTFVKKGTPKKSAMVIPVVKDVAEKRSSEVKEEINRNGQRSAVARQPVNDEEQGARVKSRWPVAERVKRLMKTTHRGAAAAVDTHCVKSVSRLSGELCQCLFSSDNPF